MLLWGICPMQKKQLDDGGRVFATFNGEAKWRHSIRVAHINVDSVLEQKTFDNPGMATSRSVVQCSLYRGHQDIVIILPVFLTCKENVGAMIQQYQGGVFISIMHLCQ